MAARSNAAYPSHVKEIRHFHFCCGLGGGKKGFNKSTPRVGNIVGQYRCSGGIDIDPAAVRDFDNAGPGRPGTVMDLFTREQYTAFHGKEPSNDWHEATSTDIRRAAGNEHPHVVFISSPCKGASGLLSQTLSLTPKYQALNALTLRCVWLMCEAWKDDPVELIVFENVPRLASRGRHLLDQINQLLGTYGYAVAETTHDCGELGGLAQSRKRFLLVARHIEKVPPFLYEPEKKRLQSVGAVLGRMPMPGHASGGPMHRIPSLQWKTWVRLAFVTAGKDWRSLNDLAIEDGNLRDYLIVPCGQEGSGPYGVKHWDEPVGTIAGRSGPTNGAFSVADPRKFSAGEYGQYGVLPWESASGAISGQSAPGGGKYSVADPRPHHNTFKIVRFEKNAQTVAGAAGLMSSACVADPRRVRSTYEAKLGVTEWCDPAFAVADPRPRMNRGRGDHYLTGGHYGVVGWDQSSGAVSAAACHDNGRWSVADPRRPDPRMPAPNEKIVARIQALDGTCHRPITTLEMAAIQSIIEPEEYLELDGLSDQAWRERIGNAVPPDAAQAIADVMGVTLLLAWSGQTFTLSAMPIWVRSVAVAISVSQGEMNA